MDASIPRWHVVQAHQHCEETAHTHLLQQGFTCYLPLVYNDERVMPLFSGYLFVRFTRLVRWQAILSTEGVKSLLGLSRADPTPVRDTVVSTLMDACVTHAGKRVLLPGLRVTFTRGQFSGSPAIVEWSMPDRVSLLMRILGREVSVLFTREEFEELT